MKFTDGCWKMRARTTAHYPAQVHGVDIEPDALTVYAPSKFQVIYEGSQHMTHVEGH